MQKNTPRLDHLVSMRGIAAWWVVFFHSLGLMIVAFPSLPGPLTKLISQGYLAVDFFFVLSGFIIFINYHGKFTSNFRHNILPFYWNRLTRIYPVHLIMLLAYLALAGVFLYTSASHALPPAFGEQLFFENLFLVQAWQVESTSWNVPAWSVSAEWFVYLLFPFIAAGLARFTGNVLTKVALAAAVFAAVVATGMYQPNTGTTPTLMLPLVRAAHEFLLGAIAGALFIHHKERLVQAKGFLLLAITIVVAANFFIKIPYYFFVPFLCFVSICILSIDESKVTQLLSAKWLVYLGEISYSTYMIHYFIKDVFKATLMKDMHSVNPYALSGSFFLVLLASVVMHRSYEIPAQNYLRKRFFASPKKAVHA